MAQQLKSLESDIRNESEALQTIQKEINKNADAQRQFTAQLKENEIVLQELDRDNSEDGVFKLVGPTLIKQDPLEARANVGKRLEFIRRELERLSSQSEAMSQKQSRKQQQIQKLQATFQEANAKLNQQ